MAALKHGRMKGGKPAPMPGVGTGKVPKPLKMGKVQGPNKGKRGG